MRGGSREPVVYYAAKRRSAEGFAKGSNDFISRFRADRQAQQLGREAVVREFRAARGARDEIVMREIDERRNQGCRHAEARTLRQPDPVVEAGEGTLEGKRNHAADRIGSAGDAEIVGLRGG